MKLSVSLENLQKKLSFVNHAVSLRHQLPILSHVLLEASGQNLTLHSTDLEIGIEAKIQAEIEEEGKIAVPAKLFLDLISSLSQDTVTLRQQDKTLEVLSKKTKSIIQTLDNEEFPKLYEEKGEEITRLSSKNFINDFRKVVFAASVESTRPTLSGVLIEKKGEKEEGGFVLVATDGYRLSLKNYSLILKDTTTWEKSLVVPARVIREVIAMHHEDEDIGLSISKKQNQAMFVLSDILIIGRLIEAEFPVYQKIIPSDFNSQALFDREELQKAVKICSLFARDASNIVRLSLKKDSIVASAEAPSVGKNEVEVEASLTGEENDIAFNARFLLDLFSNVDEDEMVFQMTGPLNPGSFSIKDDPSFLHIIMPIRVQAEV